MTLISVWNSDGLVGRCDAKCYDATGYICHCVCNGMNHGAGQRTAAGNTEEMSDAIIDKYEQTRIQPNRVTCIPARNNQQLVLLQL